MKKEIISGIFFAIVVLALAALYSAPTIIHFDEILAEAEASTISFLDMLFWIFVRVLFVAGLACSAIPFIKWLIKKRDNSSHLYVRRRA